MTVFTALRSKHDQILAMMAWWSVNPQKRPARGRISNVAMPVSPNRDKPDY